MLRYLSNIYHLERAAFLSWLSYLEIIEQAQPPVYIMITNHVSPHCTSDERHESARITIVVAFSELMKTVKD